MYVHASVLQSSFAFKSALQGQFTQESHVSEVEKLMEKVEELDKPVPSKKPKGKGAPKPRSKKKVSDSDTVLAIIKRFKKGVDGATLRERTGFEGRKMRDIVYRLKKRGKIKVLENGIYMKA